MRTDSENAIRCNTGNVKVTITAPVAVVHWFGRKANVSDVHAGLVLQRHAPFVFHFENIAFINFADSKAASSILDLLVSPEVLLFTAVA